MRKIPFLIFATVVIFVASIGPARSTQRDSRTTKSKDLAKTIQVEVEMVLVNVGVIDLQNRPVTDLQKDNFRLFENNVEQEIVSFSHQDAPTSIGIIFDTSGSMGDKIARSREAFMRLLKTANPQDEFSLVSFATHAKLMSAFTSNIEELHEAISSTKPFGQTALLDAIHLAMSHVKYAHNQRCAMVVISDGGDNSSWHSESRIRKDLKEADCPLYAIGIYSRRDMTLTLEERNGPGLLSELAEITGGHAFETWKLDELPGIAAEISLEIRDQYLLGYRPGTPHDGRWRGIKVKVKPPANRPPLHVYARSGYYSPRD